MNDEHHLPRGRERQMLGWGQVGELGQREAGLCGGCKS